MIRLTQDSVTDDRTDDQQPTIAMLAIVVIVETPVCVQSSPIRRGASAACLRQDSEFAIPIIDRTRSIS
jgi:hypothetical protein